MNDGFIKVACCVPKIRLADVFSNTFTIIDRISELNDRGVELAVFPELCLTGYTLEDLFLQERLLQTCEKGIKKILDETADFDSIFLIGAPFEFNGKIYNCAFVIYQGNILGIVPKINIPSYSEFYEARQFTSGKNLKTTSVKFAGCDTIFGNNLVFKSKYFSFAVEICEDLWVGASPSEKLAASGAQIICNLSASDEVIGKKSYRRTLVKAKSGTLYCGYLYANSGAGESTTDKVYSGHSLIAEDGSILAESEMFKTGSIISDIDILKLKYERIHSNTFSSINDYANYIDFDYDIKAETLDRKIDPHPFVPSEKEILSDRCKEILDIQSAGLQTRLSAISKCTKSVIGLSGGLDSTLAIIVAAHAYDNLGLSRDNIKAITMPCFGTTDRTYKNACTLAKSIGAELIEIPIEKAVMQHFSDIGHSPENHDVTYENSQARERTQVLMDYANKIGGIVIGTGDLSEQALGWATYNADHMSMYNVNGSIPKTLVRYIVAYEAQNTEGELSETLQNILDTPVSPELLPPTGNGKISQKTEEIVGPYELHDFFLYYMIRFGFSAKKIFRLASVAFKEIYDDKTILKWEKVFYKRFFTQQFKRSCMPDGPKVGTVTLSPRGDWRMPSDASGRIWLDELDQIEEIIN